MSTDATCKKTKRNLRFYLSHSHHQSNAHEIDSNTTIEMTGLAAKNQSPFYFHYKAVIAMHKCLCIFYTLKINQLSCACPRT